MDGTEEVTQEQEQEQQQENTSDQQSPPLQTPAPIDFDYRGLYQESTRARIAAETELERLRNESRQTSTPSEPEITDEDVGRAPATAIRTMIRNELKAALGPVHQVTERIQISDALENAESVVWSTYPPQMQQYRDNLGPKVRAALKGAKSIDPSVYAVTLDAIIGQEARMALMNQPVAPQPQQRSAPSGAPAPRPNGGPPPVSGNAPQKITEMERGAMKRAGFDPNKPADIKAFFDIVNNDEGISV